MFQTPVNNLEKIRKARKRVKQLLLQIGLETCREVYEGYRSKQFCCSLCKFETRLLASYKNHLQRYHEDEKDQEIMTSCPSCPFTSHRQNVLRHMRIFHTSNRRVQSPVETTPTVKYSCGKCTFTDTLYYTLKRHVLLTHYKSEFESYFGEKSEEEHRESRVKIHSGRFYCKKCNYSVTSHDALMYHVLTSDKHRDLEQKLKTDISDTSRTYVRRPYKKMHLTHPALSPKPQTLPNSPVVSPTPGQETQKTLTQNGPSQPLLRASPALVSNIVPSVTSVPDPAGGLVKTSTTVASTSQVGFVTSSLPQNQGITLQGPLSQSVFLSPRFTLNQPVTATMLPSACSVSGQIVPGAQTAGRSTVLPINQSMPGGLLSMNQSTVLACPQSLQSNILQMNQAVRPTVFSMSQPMKSGNVPGSQPGVPQNTFLAASIIRQLIPTGKQVNGMPTYTLITLPVAPCAIPAVNPPKVPVQLSQPDKVVQVSTSPASAPSPPVVQVAQATSKPTPNKTPAKSSVAPSALDKETRQWKTCPVCNELFPSNVYEVHMHTAHIKQEISPDNPLEPVTNSESKQTVVVAAHASFLKVLKDKAIRCVTCKRFTQKKEVLQHLLMHGMVCLYCKTVFYELRKFIYHMKILHVGKKKIHEDFVKKGLTLACDANEEVLFPHFNFTFQVPKEELGEKEMQIAVVTGTNSNTASPLYFKVQSSAEPSSDTGTTGVQQGSKCSFCDHVLTKSEVYETHLKDRHHIMPTVHTILKSPAFKCIHCCGVYTGSMTMAAIALHLQRCRNAPKDSVAALELAVESSTASKGQPKAGQKSVDGKQSTDAETPVSSTETKNGQKNGPSASKEMSPVPSKRRRMEAKSDLSELNPLDDNVDVLAMVPDSFATVSHEAKKDFLLKYFHVRPYPTRKEILLLAHVLDMWKSDVASFFGTRRYICMRSLRNQKQQVLFGFKMDELKKVKHDIDLPEDY
ncbi:activity-dependent neuroprotector homeobox protein 2 isoform X2 [Hyperolius riggenbachi]|uniref:activity-dependent neuroprotector homeobox protein 2 isoform X2 n=1 Tax=Hyperolius riggenbachi TaxID=752182 RepID=UPI0035A36443